MKLVTDYLYRGSKADAFAAISDEIVDIVINLETETRELIFGGANEELLSCLYHHVGMFDFALSGYMPPQPEVVKAILKIIDGFPAAKILIHCRAGHERTGYVIAAYRILVEGWTFDDAVKEWAAEGCHWLWILMWSGSLRKLVME